MNSRKINYRSVLISIALVAIPIALVAILYPILPVIQVPRLGLNGRYLKIVDKHVYYLLALIPIFIYYRLKNS
jgi:hypothetical protein